jgi:hypothetical protein
MASFKDLKKVPKTFGMDSAPENLDINEDPPQFSRNNVMRANCSG